jgi:hypothetical protein
LLVVGLTQLFKAGVARAPGSFTSGRAGGFRRQAQRANNKTGLLWRAELVARSTRRADS